MFLDKIISIIASKNHLFQHLCDYTEHKSIASKVRCVSHKQIITISVCCNLLTIVYMIINHLLNAAHSDLVTPISDRYQSLILVELRMTNLRKEKLIEGRS